MSKKLGRPLLYEAEQQALKVFSVRLNALQVRKAMKIGDGNLSEGIRRALAYVLPKKEITE